MTLGSGCDKPDAGPETPEVARKIQTENIKIPETNAPAHTAAIEITDGDRAYWAAYCKQFGFGDNFYLDGRVILVDLPRAGVTDPLLIDIHNTTVKAFDSMGKELDAAARNDPSAAHPSALQTKTAQLLKPKLDKAAAKYGIPQNIQEKSPLFNGTNNLQQTN